MRDIALGALIGGAVGFAAGALLGAGISGALTGSFASGVKDVVAGGIRVIKWPNMVEELLLHT